jgi:hypothetical protein
MDISVKKFIESLNSKRVEGEIIKTILYSLLASFSVLIILYLVKFRFIDNFLEKYGIFFLLFIISLSFMLAIVRQIRAYKEFNCMSGMMIGMTIGMISGFLSGFFVGATNGMFFGSMIGIIVGISFGIWNGSYCGIMGILEGIMAGFMGGLMGSMSSVMMINDHLITASIAVTLVCLTILIGLSYMVYKETIERDRVHNENHLFTIIVSAILITSISLFMVFGPRGGL